MYFVAIVCPEAINEKVLQYKLWMQQNFGCKAALKSPAHITLVAPFYFEDAAEAVLYDAFQSFALNQPVIEIRLNGFSHFGKRVIFIDVAKDPLLESICKTVIEHFHQLFPAIIKEENRPFTPHVTIANRDVTPGAFIKAWEYFSKKEFEADFTTSTVSLLKLTEGRWKVVGQKAWINNA